MNIYRTHYFYLLWLSMALLISACQGSFLSPNKATPPPLGPSPSWHGIILGQTTLSDALDVVGQPDKVEQRFGYEVYRYFNRSNMENWEKVELWISTADTPPTVMGLFRSTPYWEKSRSIADIQTLAQLIEKYGKPDKVTWTMFCNARYLIWAREGVAATASAKPSFRYPQEYVVSDVLFFAPVNIEQFMRGKDWPYPDDGSGWTSWNTCNSQTTDSPDTLPEDPYNWDKLLAPTPSGTTQQ